MVNISNALTVDVEDYFHVSAFSKNINKNEWDRYPSRVDRNTRRLLDLFDEFNIKATFFVLGWVAERDPGLVKEIDARGHEIACHGYSHQLIYKQPIDVFKKETVKSKSILQDIVQKPILGYRAASYSIIQESRWALDILCEAGFKYDSSIFPIRHDRYGIPDAVEVPHVYTTENDNSIVEFPLTTITMLGIKLPIAGGGYFRLYPYQLTKAGLNKVNKKNRPFIFYLHPWEIDPDQPRIKTSLLSTFRHYNNLDKCESRLKCLLKDFKFCTAHDVLVQQKIIQ